MSRIHEALRRAELERKVQSETEDEIPVAPDGNLAGEDHSLRMTAALSSNVAKHEWKPSTDAIPCMLQRGPVVEQFRGLRSRINDARYEHPLKTILVSSSIPMEGKSFVSMNLAVSLIRHSVNRVLLIDGDLRRPTLHRMLGTSSEPGLSEYLAGEKELSEVLQQSEPHGMAESAMDGALSNLIFLPAGKCCDNSAELLANGRLQQLIASVAQSFDWILIDSPPVLAITDAAEIARCTDAVLLVARHGFTPFDVMQRTQAALQQYRILGAVLNASTGTPDEQGYYGYFSDADADSPPEKTKRSRV